MIRRPTWRRLNRSVAWIGDQFYEHPQTYVKQKETEFKLGMREKNLRKAEIPTPNIDPEREDTQLKDHIFDYILKNGPTTTGHLWRHLKPLGLLPSAKGLHGRLFYFYGSKFYAFKRSPLVYVRRNPDTWQDRQWLLRLNDHLLPRDHKDNLELHQKTILEHPLSDPTYDSVVMWYYRMRDDCGAPHQRIEGPVTTQDLLQLHANGKINSKTRCFSFRSTEICWLPFDRYEQLKSRIGEFEADFKNHPRPKKIVPKGKWGQHKINEYIRNLYESPEGIPNYLEHLGYTPLPEHFGIKTEG